MGGEGEKRKWEWRSASRCFSKVARGCRCSERPRLAVATRQCPQVGVARPLSIIQKPCQATTITERRRAGDGDCDYVHTCTHAQTASGDRPARVVHRSFPTATTDLRTRGTGSRRDAPFRPLLRSSVQPIEQSNSSKKSFDSIRFDSRYRIDFFRFDSIRQSDKFAACTLIFK